MDGQNQFQTKREEVSLSFDPAVKLLPSLQKPMDHADELADNEDYDAAVKQLEETGASRNVKRCSPTPRRNGPSRNESSSTTARWASGSSKSAKRRSARWKSGSTLPSSKQTDSQQKLENELDELKKTPDRGGKLNALYKEASEAAEALDFVVAFQKIQEATTEGQELRAANCPNSPKASIGKRIRKPRKASRPSISLPKRTISTGGSTPTTTPGISSSARRPANTARAPHPTNCSQ